MYLEVGCLLVRGGGIKGRLELFQKIIRFGMFTHPLVNTVIKTLKEFQRHLKTLYKSI